MNDKKRPKTMTSLLDIDKYDSSMSRNDSDNISFKRHSSFMDLKNFDKSNWKDGKECFVCERGFGYSLSEHHWFNNK